MRAAVITRPGGPEVLEVREVERPVAGAGELLVRVRGSAINRADVLQRAGRYPAPLGSPTDIPGIEFAGEVAAIGPGVREWKEGDRVFGIIGGGAHAEYLVVHERAVARVPDSLSWDDAGAVPEAFITAHDALVTQADVRPGECVLVHAVGSGVGLAAVQIACALGASVFGTTRTAEKLERARAYGLTDCAAVDNDVATLVEHSKRWTAGRGMDVVLDLVGGPYVAPSVESLALKGRVILIGTVAGPDASLPLRVMLTKRATVRGTVLRARPLEEKILATRAFASEIVSLLARGTIRVPLDRVYPLDRIAEAHAYVEGNGSFGKVGLRIAE
jgi:NADPH:quinone reductase